MKPTTNLRIRRSVTCITAALAIALPGLASAEKGRIQAIKTSTGTLFSNVRGNVQEKITDKPMLNAIEEGKETAAEVFEQVKQMHVLEQLRETVEMMKQMQADYDSFSGGQRCGGTCAGFRSSLKSIVENFLVLSQEVPALSNASGLIENLRRMSNLIDYVPPRALYLMWQTMSGKIAELEYVTDEIRQTLAALPPLMPASSLAADSRSNSTGTRSSQARTGGFCDWADEEKKPYIDLVQARLEKWGWELEKVADLIPDVETKGEAGASAGAAVANGTGAAGVGVKPTDSPKILLKAIALIPQELSWTIKLNVLRAKAVCSTK